MLLVSYQLLNSSIIGYYSKFSYQHGPDIGSSSKLSYQHGLDIGTLQVYIYIPCIETGIILVGTRLIILPQVLSPYQAGIGTRMVLPLLVPAF
jgi:hypothetical protein